jgi:hypothetical protein
MKQGELHMHTQPNIRARTHSYPHSHLPNFVIPGELCVLTCTPEFAYGARGSPPKIPANATLQFEVELLSWSLGADDLFSDEGCPRLLLPLLALMPFDSFQELLSRTAPTRAIKFGSTMITVSCFLSNPLIWKAARLLPFPLSSANSEAKPFFQ